MHLPRHFLLLSAVVLGACAAENVFVPDPTDGAADTTTDNAVDTTTDSGVDAPGDTAPDAPPDTAPDTGVDTAPDTQTDTGPDRGDTNADTGLDTNADTGLDTGLDTGVDTGRDTAVDTALDTARDTGGDTSGDAPGDGGGGLCLEPTAARPPCEAAVCGNGALDTCMRDCRPCFMVAPFRPPPGDGGVCCTNASESCDGALLGGRTCASLGYRGGSLRCAGTCTLDVSRCDPCNDAPQVAGCANLAAVVDTRAAFRVAVAANGGVIALAWLTHNGGATSGSGSLHLALFNPDLTLRRELPCFGGSARWVSLVAAGSGFVLATAEGAGIQLRAFGTDGAERASRAVPGQLPLLVGRPAAQPLLVFTTGSSVSAGLLGDDLSVGASRALFASATEFEYGSGVFVGDGFLVAMRDTPGVGVVRFNLDGTGSGPVYPVGGSNEYPQVGWTGTEGRLTYASFGSDGTGLRYARLDRNGNRLGDIYRLGSIPGYFNYSPILGMPSGESVALLGVHTGTTGQSSRIDIARLTAGGAPATPPVPAQGGPEWVISYGLTWNATPIGMEPIAAWATTRFPDNGAVPGRVVLARLRP